MMGPTSKAEQDAIYRVATHPGMSVPEKQKAIDEIRMRGAIDRANVQAELIRGARQRSDEAELRAAIARANAQANEIRNASVPGAAEAPPTARLPDVGPAPVARYPDVAPAPVARFPDAGPPPTARFADTPPPELGDEIDRRSRLALASLAKPTTYPVLR